MYRYLLTLVLLCLMAGCHGNSPSTPNLPDSDGTGSGGLVQLNLTSQDQDGTWRVTLTAQDASDLYQAAGRLSFPQGEYDVLAVEAGGGLGGPQDCYFAGKETAPGQVDFAYTRRFYGTGVAGEAALLRVVVAPRGKFALKDFRLADEPRLLLRDSKKRVLTAAGEVRE